MGLQKRKKLKHLGAPEWVGVTLLVLTVAAGASWIYENSVRNWTETQARIVPVQSGDGPKRRVRFTYSYHVRGREYGGAWSGSPRRATLLLAGNEDHFSVSALMKAAQVMGFDNLPEKAQALLLERGIDSNRALREQAQNFLESHGDPSFRDLPPDVRESLEHENVHNVADLERVIEKQTDLAAGDDPLRATASPVPLTPVAGNASVDRRLSITLLYDPRRPQRNRIKYPGSHLNPAYGLAFAGIGLGALFYFVVIYPALKRVDR